MAPQHVDPKGTAIHPQHLVVNICVDNSRSLVEAIQVHVDVNAKVSVAMHWGTYHLSDVTLTPPVYHKVSPPSSPSPNTNN